MPATRTSKASSSSKASRDPSTEPPPTASSSKDIDDKNEDELTAAPSVKERSRNAKAQARHREKRKAYIEHLEKTVTALKAQLASMGISSPSPSILASPADAAANEARLRALQEENERLKREIRSLRDRLDAMSSSRSSSAYPPHGHSLSMAEESMSRRRSFDEGGAGGPAGSYMDSSYPLVPLSLSIPQSPSLPMHLQPPSSYAGRPSYPSQDPYQHHSHPHPHAHPSQQPLPPRGSLSSHLTQPQQHRHSLPLPSFNYTSTPSHSPAPLPSGLGLQQSSVREWPPLLQPPVPSLSSGSSYTFSPSAPPSRTTSTSPPRSVSVSPGERKDLPPQPQQNGGYETFGGWEDGGVN